MIKRLPEEVRSKLRSGVALPSLQQCVEELVLNSVDAEATCVAVRLDAEAFRVQVADNGAGLDAEDMRRAGDRYHTSKCRAVEDLERLRWYGFRGEALASIASLSALVEISSRTRSSARTHVRIFRGGRAREVFEARAPRPSAGTTVVVCDLFHSAPVRRRRVDPVLEAERIRHRLEAVALMHPSVSFTLKNDCTGAVLVQLPKARDTHHRFVQIHGLRRAQSLREVSHERGPFRVTGHIGREGHYNNSLQFLYVNGRLLLRTQIHKLLNVFLRRPSGHPRSDGPDGESALRSPKSKRSQELHGVYVINITCPYSEYDVCLEPAKTLIEFREWDSVLQCVEEAVKVFLNRENLTSEVPAEELAASNWPASPVAQVQNGSACSEQAAGSGLPADCGIAVKLASRSVQRRSKDADGVGEGSQSRVLESSATAEDKERTAEKGPEERKNGGSVAEKQSCPDRVERSSGGDPIQEKTAFPLSHPGSREVQLKGQESVAQQTGAEKCCHEPTLKEHLHTGHGHSAAAPAKISLSDPYVHECLQSAGPVHCSRSAHHNISVQTGEDGASEVKRKITLRTDHDRTCQKRPTQDFVSIVPPKTQRTSGGPRVFLSKESGSLDKFRRIYGTWNKLESRSRETSQGDELKPLQMELLGGIPVRSEIKVDQSHAPEKQGVDETPRKAAALLVPDPRPSSVSSRGEKSLASKLRLLKQCRANPSDVVSLSQGGHDNNNSSNNRNLRCAANPDPDGATASCDWIHHYDSSLGKSTYINKVTGLSRYEEQPAEKTSAHCTSDLTCTAVDVVSAMGVEYTCYPFQAQLVLPFLPKSRTERVISSGLNDRDEPGGGVNSLTSLYSKWKNPVFLRPPTVAVDISNKQAEGLAVKIHNILFPYRFSKDMIHSMKVIQQVDKKFLACLISTKEPSESPETEGNLLVLVDQHAAHERVRLENLIADSYEDDPDARGERRLCSSSIRPPLEISVTEEELRLFQSCRPHLRSLGLELKLPQEADRPVLVGKVPVCFTEKERNEIRRGRPSVIKAIVEEYLREQIELLCSAGRVRGTLPLTVLKVLASLACHGAIKFNDTLSRDECVSLAASLSCCQLPFQCAHGRPSIAPLVDVLHLGQECEELQKPNLGKLRRMYEAWELRRNK